MASSERHACVLGTLLLFLLFRMKLSANSVPFSMEILASSAVEGRDNSEALWLFSLFPAVFGCILEGFVQKKAQCRFGSCEYHTDPGVVNIVNDDDKSHCVTGRDYLGSKTQAKADPLSRGLPTVGRSGAVLIELGQRQAKPLDRTLAQRP